MIADALLEKLKSLDELSLLELLDVSSSEIIDAFYDKIQDRLAYILENLED